MSYRSGRHFLQIPGPTNVPDRVLRAIDAPTIDHRGPDFARLGLEVLDGLQRGVPDRRGPWSSTRRRAPARGRPRWSTRSRPATACSRSRPGTSRRSGGRWPSGSGSRSCGCEGDWRHGVDPDRVGELLAADAAIRAVMVVHNETSTGVTSRVAEVRAAIDAAGHDALLLVDDISSLGSIDYRHDEWGVDVTVGGSQKGLMLPAGLSFNAVSEKALRRRGRRAAAALLLGLGADHRGQRDRLLALHVGHQPALRAARVARDARRGGPASTCSPATPGTPRRRARRSRPGASRCCAPTSASTRPR